MFRFLCFLLITFSSISLTHWASKTSNTEMARDLSEILQNRISIESLSGTGRTYMAFTQQYFRDLDTFVDRYATPFRVFALRPTVDRSLSYRLHIQQYSLSCEIAALRIILDRLGIVVTENDILANIPQFPVAYGSGGIWWDPDVEFVGSYTGWQTKRTGYGIYEVPLAHYAKDLSLVTEIINEYSYSGSMNPTLHMMSLLEKLEQPNTHILLWWDWCTDPQSEDGVLAKWGRSILSLFPLPARNPCDRSASSRAMNWITQSGKNITGLSGEHAFVLLGYVGTITNPSNIIVWDTYTGRHVYPYIEWMRKWSLMQYRSLIISD